VYAWENKPNKDDPSLKPNVDLNLIYVPSYNGKNARNNIYFIDRHHIAFFVRIIYSIIHLIGINRGNNNEYKYI
jgi:hypothetical protein